MRDAYRHFLAEFVGTFALVFVGGGAIIQSAARNSPSGLVEVALAHGLILALMVSALMRISGHFNPAVTVAFLVTRRIEAMMAGLYIVAQILGAMVAAYALKTLLPGEAAMAARLGGQSVALGVTFGQAVALEAIGTFFLVWVIWGTAVDPQAPKIGGLAIGLTLSAVIFAIGPYTGASINPARSLGPAVASGMFDGLAVYWTGPFIGAIAAALLYEAFMLKHPVEPVDHGAVQPVE
ncbi:MAG TPA: aquaporin [Gemmatimonadaceae bacterium]